MTEIPKIQHLFYFNPNEAPAQPARALVAGPTPLFYFGPTKSAHPVVAGPTPLKPSQKVPDGWAMCRHEPTAVAPECVRHPRWAVGATGSAAGAVEHYHPADSTVSLKAYLDYQPLPEMIAESLAAHLDAYESKDYECITERVSDGEFLRGYVVALIDAGIMVPNHPLAIMIAYSQS